MGEIKKKRRACSFAKRAIEKGRTKRHSQKRKG